jgi:hypothetical protein
MVDLFRVFKDADGEINGPYKISFTHHLGDIVSHNSFDNKYKCVEIVNDEEMITYIFKQGVLTYTYDW